jgi:hypothetical protein
LRGDAAQQWQLRQASDTNRRHCKRSLNKECAALDMSLTKLLLLLLLPLLLPLLLLLLLQE